MKSISDIEFVNIWQNAANRKDVALVCETSGASVGMRASKLRKAGVKLKNFKRGRPQSSLDVQLLNTTIENNNKSKE